MPYTKLHTIRISEHKIIHDPMIEKQITELTEALIETTAALIAHMEAFKSAPEQAAKPAAKAAAPKKAKLEVVEPEAAEDETAATPTPTAKGEPKIAVDDTPHVPATAPAQAGQPDAGEYVDVDEVIAQINSAVKGKLLKASDPEAVKDKWATIRKGYGVERIADLKSQPAKLLLALKQAESL